MSSLTQLRAAAQEVAAWAETRDPVTQVMADAGDAVTVLSSGAPHLLQVASWPLRTACALFSQAAPRVHKVGTPEQPRVSVRRAAVEQSDVRKSALDYPCGRHEKSRDFGR